MVRQQDEKIPKLRPISLACQTSSHYLSDKLSPQRLPPTSNESSSTMQIASVEVPAELVGMIAHELVNTCLSDAWKAHGICTVFKDLITSGIVPTQSPETLARQGRLLKKLLPQYLFYKTLKLRGQEDPLLVSNIPWYASRRSNTFQRTE
jgi:hypothetical protein